MHCVAFEKAVCCFLIRRHYLDTFFNEKAWWCGVEVGVDRLNSSVTTWWTGVGYLHIYIVQITTSGESRIIFLPERSSICQYPPKISAINIKKQSRARLLLAHPVLYILKIEKTYGTF